MRPYVRDGTLPVGEEFERQRDGASAEAPGPLGHDRERAQWHTGKSLNAEALDASLNDL